MPETDFRKVVKTVSSSDRQGSCMIGGLLNYGRIGERNSRQTNTPGKFIILRVVCAEARHSRIASSMKSWFCPGKNNLDNCVLQVKC